MFEVRFADSDIVAYKGDDYDKAMHCYIAYSDGAGEQMVFIDHSFDMYRW